MRCLVFIPTSRMCIYYQAFWPPASQQSVLLKNLPDLCLHENSWRHCGYLWGSLTGKRCLGSIFEGDVSQSHVTIWRFCLHCSHDEDEIRPVQQQDLHRAIEKMKKSKDAAFQNVLTHVCLD